MQTLADFTLQETNTDTKDQGHRIKSRNTDYQFISKLPHITSSTTYLSTYTFNDTMAKGMTYVERYVIAIYENKDAADSTNVNNVNKSGSISRMEEFRHRSEIYSRYKSEMIPQ